MTDFIKANIRGLKCDNKKCDYQDMSIQYEDYEDYVNVGCPKCGESLLTEKDYKAVKTLVKQAQKINNVMRVFQKDNGEVEEKDGEMVKVSADLDGKGEYSYDVSLTDGKGEDFKGISKY